MRLSKEDVALFYKLYPALLVYTNSKRSILEVVTTPDQLMSQAVEERVKVRDQLFENISPPAKYVSLSTGFNRDGAPAL